MSEIKKKVTVADQLKENLSGNIDDQCAKGLKTYNKTLDDCAYDDYDWNLMANQELVDSNQYLLMEIGGLKALLKAKDEEIARLKSQALEKVLTFHPPLEIHKLDVSQIKELIKALQDMEQHIYSPNLREEPDFSNLKPEPEQSPQEALDNAVDEYKAVSERDEIIEDLRDENEGLIREIEDLKISRLEWRNNSFNAQDEIAQLRALLSRSWGVQ